MPASSRSSSVANHAQAPSPGTSALGLGRARRGRGEVARLRRVRCAPNAATWRTCSGVARSRSATQLVDADGLAAPHDDETAQRLREHAVPAAARVVSPEQDVRAEGLVRALEPAREVHRVAQRV